MFKGLSLLLRETRYVVAILLITVLVYISIVFSLNSGFVQVVAEGDAQFFFKLGLLLNLLLTSFSVNPWLTAGTTLLIACLFALNLALTVFVFNRQLARVRGGSSLGFIGFLSALFGLGCASCGPLLVTSILPLIGLGGLTTILPFNGREFQVLGILILLSSCYYLSKQASKPAIC